MELLSYPSIPTSVSCALCLPVAVVYHTRHLTCPVNIHLRREQRGDQTQQGTDAKQLADTDSMVWQMAFWSGFDKDRNASHDTQQIEQLLNIYSFVRMQC